MIVLGITGLFHDASAALVRDGELIAFAEEERLIRDKHSHGKFPYRSIEFCLSQFDLTYKDLDTIAYYYDCSESLSGDWSVEPFFSHFKNSPKDLLGYVENLQMIRRYVETFAEAVGVKLEVVDHHDCHLATAYYCSPFKNANILSLDARGETVTAVMARGEGANIQRLGAVPMPHSVGMLYSAVTQFLGFSPLDGEGSVMGLASYGQDKYKHVFDEIVTPTADGFVTDPSAYWSRETVAWLSGVPNGLIPYFGQPRPYRKNPIDGTDENIAASLQCVTEKIAAHLFDLLYEKTGYRDYCVAGGVGLNAKMNGCLLNHPSVERLYVPPASNDPGCAIGAAFLAYARRTGRRPRALAHPYFGPEWSNGQIRSALDQEGMSYSECNDVTTRAAELLAEGKILGWFQGRMEMGPRALGNRSILANPSEVGMKDRVNNLVKHREPWRPFGPSVTSEHKDLYFVTKSDAPFMTMALPTTQAGQRDLSAAVHVDTTARAQVVTRQSNPRYHSLITEFGRLSGVFGVLNTSFNLKGDPVVHTPSDAIDMFRRTGMDHLVMGDFVVSG